MTVSMRTAERIEEARGRAGQCDELAQVATARGDHTKARLYWNRMHDWYEYAEELESGART